MAQHRHKRETNARRPKAIQIAAPIAIMATVSAVSLGVLTATPSTDEFLAASSNIAGTTVSFPDARDEVVSRSESRLSSRQVDKRAAKVQAKAAAKQEAKQEKKATVRAVKRADTKVWTTTELNLWSSADAKATQVGVIDGVEKVLLTGREANGRVEVVVGDQSRWVSPGYFSDEKPETGPSLGGTCSNGSSVDAGSPSLYDIHDVVCSNWPEVTSYGTWRSDGEHGQGRAIDIMISGETGWEIAEFLRANYSALGIEYIIYSQQMWSVERSGEGWRSMSDRGSTTANHYDHVHVTVY